MWAGVIGAAISWVLMFIVGYGVTLATCNGHVGRDVPLSLWSILATVIGALLAVLGLASAIVVFRATRGVGDEPPQGRIHFLSAVGIVVSPIFLFVILLSGLGAIVLRDCVQA
jgi:uncharacterized membrane protein